MKKPFLWLGLILVWASGSPAFCGPSIKLDKDNPLHRFPASRLAYYRHVPKSSSYMAVLRSGEVVYYDEINNPEAGDFSFSAHLYLFGEEAMNDQQLRAKVEWFSKLMMGPEVFPEVKKYLDSVKDLTVEPKDAYRIPNFSSFTVKVIQVDQQETVIALDLTQ